jgi:hypothetical protein
MPLKGLPLMLVALSPPLSSTKMRLPMPWSVLASIAAAER